ncbi:MAG: transglutaminase family protein, partial [Actinomycetales bacterium]
MNQASTGTGRPESMQLRIRHTTGYQYAEGAAASYNEARMTPLTTSDQYVLRSRLDVTPTAWSVEYRDYWGSTVTSFEVHEPHETLSVVSTSTVETSAHTQEPGEVAWDDLAAVQDEWCEYLVASRWV